MSCQAAPLSSLRSMTGFARGDATFSPGPEQAQEQGLEPDDRERIKELLAMADPKDARTRAATGKRTS